MWQAPRVDFCVRIDPYRILNKIRPAKSRAIIAVAALLALVVAFPAVGATVVYDTFGPGDSYSPSPGYVFFDGPPGTIRDFRVGNQFVPSSSGTLASVTLAAGIEDSRFVQSPSNSLLVQLRTNEIQNGQQQPGSFLASALVNGQMGVVGSSIVTANFGGSIAIDAGTPYWIVALPNPSSPLSGGWSTNSIGTTGWNGQYLSQFAVFPPGSILSEWVTSDSLQGAFRVEANLIPIPAAFWLFGFALLSLGSMGCRKRRTK